jgi:dihydrofolate reductase
MSTVFTEASMSLDGYIAGPEEAGFEHLFRWYGNGDVDVPNLWPDLRWQTTPASAEHLRALLADTGALVVGRRLFDLANGWGGTHPIGVPVVVVTHEPPTDWPRGATPFTFVADGIERAVERARELADGRAVGVNGGVIARQCLDAGLLDEIRVNLVPLLLGGGVPFFEHLRHLPVQLDDPTVIEGSAVTHLYYRVRRDQSAGTD